MSAVEALAVLIEHGITDIAEVSGLDNTNTRTSSPITYFVSNDSEFNFAFPGYHKYRVTFYETSVWVQKWDFAGWRTLFDKEL